MSTILSTLSIQTLSATPVSESQPPSATATSTSQGSSSSQNYLFFIALALGVVFVNLWVVLGVRFLYGRRQRRHGHMDHEDQPPDLMIPLSARGLILGPAANRQARPRRRREKKVVSVAFLDDNFPVTNYGEWKHAHLLQEKSVDEKEDKEFVQYPEVLSDDDLEGLDQTTSNMEGDTLAETMTSKVPHVEPPSTPDTCAICLEQLEDSSDVRVLRCKHVFHYNCITPWMTNRNASCPLCKTLYYIPPPPPLPEWLSNNGQGVDSLPNMTEPEADSAAIEEPQRPAAAHLATRLGRFKQAISFV